MSEILSLAKDYIEKNGNKQSDATDDHNIQTKINSSDSTRDALDFFAQEMREEKTDTHLNSIHHKSNNESDMNNKKVSVSFQDSDMHCNEDSIEDILNTKRGTVVNNIEIPKNKYNDKRRRIKKIYENKIPQMNEI